MLIAHAVIELSSHIGFTGWPTTHAAQVGHMPLHAGLSVEEMGSVVWSFLDGNHVLDDPDADGTTVYGGVQITDTTTGVVMMPGCCSDLSSRFDLIQCVADGRGSPWLGHSPLPSVHFSGNMVCFVLDAERSDEVAFMATPDEVRTALDSIEGELQGFLTALEPWAAVHMPDSDSVVPRFRRGIGS